MKKLKQTAFVAVDVPVSVSPALWAVVEAALLHAAATSVQLAAQAETIVRLQRRARTHNAEQLRNAPVEWRDRKKGAPQP